MPPAEVRRFGVVAPSVPDYRDWQFPAGVSVPGAPAGEPRPDTTYLLSPAPSVQGSQNSCVWNGFPHVLETESLEVDDQSIDVSRAFGYQETRGLRGWRDQDNGSFVRDAVDVCRTVGVVSSNRMPYNEKDYRTRPTQRDYEEAYRNRIAEFYSIGTVDQARSALLLRRPSVFAFTVTDTFVNEVGETGIWSEMSGTPVGAHLVAVTGYDDAMEGGAFLVANWWKRWGLAHPLQATDKRYALHRSQYFWITYDMYASTNVWDRFALLAFPLEG